MTVRFIFAWYDLWVGVFIDRPKRRVYVFPIPCFGLVLERKPNWQKIYEAQRARFDEHGNPRTPTQGTRR